MTKKIGVSRLHLPDGRVLRNQVVVFEGGKLVRFYPLTEEEAFTSWLGGDFYVPGAEEDTGPSLY